VLGGPHAVRMLGGRAPGVARTSGRRGDRKSSSLALVLAALAGLAVRQAAAGGIDVAGRRRSEPWMLAERRGMRSASAPGQEGSSAGRDPPHPGSRAPHALSLRM
jgi:hypothetical protein